MDIIINSNKQRSINVSGQTPTPISVTPQRGGGAAKWGSITGLISDQEDLMEALYALRNEPSVLLDTSTNTLTFRLFTLQQMEGVKIFFSGASSPAKFVVTTDESNFYLNFSNDSPEGLAGEYVLDDAVEMYTDKWLLNIVVEIPSTFTISSVYIEGADCNLLEDTQWRDADIQRDVKNMDAKLGDYVLIQDDEYAPALAELDNRLSEIE